MRTAWFVLNLLFVAALPGRLCAQAGSPTSAAKQRWQLGLVVEAPGACKGIEATVPVPMDWPEQTVQEVDKEVSSQVTSLTYRVLGGGAKQMVISIPQLRAGDTARAVVTYEIIKASSPPLPQDTTVWRIPSKPSPQLRQYLGASPLIETNHGDIQRLASELTADGATAWEQVRAIYDGIRVRVRYKFDPKLESAVTALKKGEGDCGELTSLFVALCRASKIPARTVWVISAQSVTDTGHCYPEFYLEDPDGQGRWFPCQAAGQAQFGEMHESRPILQKGENFQLPRERKPVHFAAQTFRARDAQANPRVQWVQRQLAD